MIELMHTVKGIANAMDLVYLLNKALKESCGYATFMGPDLKDQACTIFLHIHNPEDMVIVARDVVSGVSWHLVAKSYEEHYLGRMEQFKASLTKG